MEKQVIVVVHGVGVRAAGVSTDLVSVALDDPPRDGPDADLSTAPRGGSATPVAWLPHSSDDFLLRELRRYNIGTRVRTFGARLRRYRRYADDNRQTVTHERVIADFYWGDISGTGATLLTVIFGLLRVVFGLSHAIRDNLASAFPGEGRRDRLLRRLGEVAALTIHGPVFALNIVLLAGFGVVKGAELAGIAGLGSMGLTVLAGLGAVAVGGGLLLWVTRVYLMRLLMCWIVLSGLAMAGVALVIGLQGSADPPVHVQTGTVLMQVMVWLWGLGLVSAAAVGIAGVIWRAEVAGRQVQPFALPAIGLMTLVWFIFIASVWAALLTATDATEAERSAILQSLAALPLAIGALLAIAVTGIYLHLRKRHLTGRMAGVPNAYMDDPDATANLHRLIVAKGLLAWLSGFVALLVILGSMSEFPPVCDLMGRHCPKETHAEGLVALLFPVLAVLAAAVVGPLRSAVAMAVDIVTDVLVYLNDHSWDSRRRGTGTSVFLERWLGLAPRQIARARPLAGYWMRQRIRDRLKVLMSELVTNELPGEIVLISHSQGTVIAIDTIDEAAADWRAAMPDGGRLRLVTMGSPYTHIYNTYFPLDFPPHRRRANLLPRAADGTGGQLDDWINIFRLDDFVGTHIDAPRNQPGEPVAGAAAQPPAGTWPKERPVPPGGHTNYWVDNAVITILRAWV